MKWPDNSETKDDVACRPGLIPVRHLGPQNWPSPPTPSRGKTRSATSLPPSLHQNSRHLRTADATGTRSTRRLSSCTGSPSFSKALEGVPPSRWAAGEQEWATRSTPSSRRPRPNTPDLSSPKGRRENASTSSKTPPKASPWRNRSWGTLIRCDSTATTRPEPPENLILQLSTSRRQRTGVPCPSRRRSGGRRGGEPAASPAFDARNPVASLSPIYYSIERGKRANKQCE